MPALNYEKLAKQICDAMRLGRKPNPGIKLAERGFGRGIVHTVLRKGEFRLEGFPPAQQKKIKKLMDLKYGPLVYRAPNGRYKAKPGVGEVLGLSYVDADRRCKKMADAVCHECWKRGVHTSIKSGNDAETKLYYRLVPEDTLAELPPFAVARAKSIDATLSIGDKQDREWSRGLEKRLLLGAPSGQKLYDIMDQKGTRWCLLGFPVKMAKKRYYLVQPKVYEKVYINSIIETYSGRLQKLCRFYRKALEGGDAVRIKADDGTDLRLSIKGRPVLVADGIIDDDDMRRGDVGLNVPDGEAFLAPLEHSANGRVFFDYCNIPGQGFAEGGLWITFRNGRVVKYEGSRESVAKFRRFLDSNTGDKDRIAELGIGTNRAARFIGTIVVDEKIYGTIHIAIGNNTGAYHGKNRASSHFDMIKVMKGRGGNLTVDGRLVMKNGEPAKKP
jgi:leucyl aminopeptidase (aminopeptidase T)